MRLKMFVMICLVCIKLVVAGQMKIGTNVTTINSASLLELETTDKGLVFPRVSLSSVSSSSPLASGLLTGTIVYNTNGSVTNGNGIGLYVWNGSTWSIVTPSINASAWSLTGNAGTSYTTNFFGTTDNKSLRLRTNNIERLIVDSLGSVGIGSSAFNTINREKLLVDYGATTSFTLANFKGSINNYLQVNFQNQSSGSNASTDYIATADDGTDSTYYIDLGINSSTYSRASHNWGGAHDSYLYSNSKNLLVGTATSNDLIFLTGGGVISTNTIMRLKNSTGNIIIGKGDNSANPVGNTIRGPNGNGTNIAGGSLSLYGGVAAGNAAGGNVNIYGGTSPSGTYGVVNINVDSASNTNINTGASTGNIILGNSSNNINLPKLSASSVVLTDASKNLTSTTPSSNTYLYYNGSNFTWQAPSAGWNLIGNNGTTAGTNFIGTTDAVDFVTKTNNTERLRITSSGYAGIGINAPETPLHVVLNTSSGTTTQDMLGLETRNTTTTSTSYPANVKLIRQVPASVYGFNINIISGLISFAHRIPGSSSTNDVMQIQTGSMNGNAGIVFATRTGMTNGNPATGTLTGSLTFGGGALTGNMILAGNTLGVANLLGGITTLSCDASGNIIRTVSDARLKTNVHTLSNSLEKVKQLRGVYYNWIDTARYGKEREVGFIAQEVEKVIPEVVKSGGEYKSVNYQVLTAVLAEAIKEQQQQIEAQQTKIDSLQKAINDQQKLTTAQNIKTKSLQKTANDQQKMIDFLMQQLKELKEKIK